MGGIGTGSGLHTGARRFAPRLRARAAIALAAIALALLPATAAPSPAAGAQNGFQALGRTVVSAIASTTNADQALNALGNGLAMIEARKKVAAAAAAAAAPKPPTAAEIAADPSKLPAASAGSNGTSIPRHDSAEAQKIFAHSRGGGESTSILLTGIALPPPDAPEAVQDVIDNANEIVGRPYIWGGGHGSFYSYGYDCSGSVSFALFGGGLIPRPLTSGELEGWGEPGPGRWITVYANGGHTFAEIAGLRWDTVGDAQGTGPRWHLATTSTAGFVARHPPGL
jgi:cell wall-associated NlpC family hydrolase